jgi:hypothetical protein
MQHTIEIPLADNVTLWMPAYSENLQLAVALWEAGKTPSDPPSADHLPHGVGKARTVRHGHTPGGLSDAEMAVLRN